VRTKRKSKFIVPVYDPLSECPFLILRRNNIYECNLKQIRSEIWEKNEMLEQVDDGNVSCSFGKAKAICPLTQVKKIEVYIAVGEYIKIK
jgi:hypothetical protein